MQPDLFTSHFPYSAGYREHTTSKENAEQIEKSGRAKTLREKVKALFDSGITATADEIAEMLHEPFRAAQPRVSELRAQGYIKPTGERRTGSGGGSSHVWCKA